MNWTSRRWTAALAWVLTSIALAPTFAQDSPPAGGSYRQLAPGVMKSVDPQVLQGETFSRHDVVELLAVDPSFDFAKDVTFHRDVWWLDFHYKPVRVMWIDVPQPSGKMQRKLIWYMVYSVTHPGTVLHPTEAEDGTWEVQETSTPIRFVPRFQVYAPDLDKRYTDRVIPCAVPEIARREDPNRPLLNSVEMTREIKPNETLWGVATWESVDPAIDSFDVYVDGLTNAYKWTDNPGQYKPGDQIGVGRSLVRKTLKLHFWRPGDEEKPSEDDRDLTKEFRLGQPGQVDYEWVYR